MGDVVLINLDHSPPRLLFVLETGLTADTDDLGIIGTACHETVESIGLDHGIGVDHEHVLVKLRVHTDDVVDLVEHFQFKRVHLGAVVDTVEEAHKQDLRVTLTTVTRPSEIVSIDNTI